ncbi:MAG: NADP-dependent 3-hydroxy acid dehydrogenase YdfG [Arenicella sp.]|jgi:NADP-dependent 3-hydroxy acid dehydrogenase YdfG
MKRFRNKTAFVTGAASGMGLALSEALIARGANVMMSDVESKSLNVAAKSLNAPAQIDTVVCDVTNHASVVDASMAVMLRFGEVNLLFNNAPARWVDQKGSTDIEDWRSIIDINVMAVEHVTEVFLRIMRSNKQHSYVVNTVSIAGDLTPVYVSPYNYTVAAVIEYSKKVRQEIDGSNIKISVLCPAWLKPNTNNVRDRVLSVSQSGGDSNDSPLCPIFKQLRENGMSAEDFAALALSSIAEERFYIFNDPVAQVAIGQILSDYHGLLADGELIPKNTIPNTETVDTA